MRAEDSFASHPLIEFFDYNNNIDVNPNNIRIRSGKPLNFKCPTCFHTFTISPHGLKGCRFCRHQELCDNKDCDSCFKKSLASRYFKDVSTYNLYLITSDETLKISNIAQLDINHPSNINKDTRLIFSSTTKNMYFKCFKCQHSFPSSPSRIAKYKDCPYCSPTNSRLLCSKELNCNLCFERSFASHPKSNCWNTSEGKNENRTPFDVLKSGTYLADFICDICNHSFQSTCNSVSSGFWCPYCPGQKRCKNNNCIMCVKRKLSSHPMSQHWNLDKNRKDIKPNDISLGNGQEKFWFNCPLEKNHPPFLKTPSKIAGGQGCPLCLRKTESKVGTFLNTYEEFTKEFTPHWLRTEIKNSFPRFDFFLNNSKIIIEIDGLQHFEERGRWGDPIERQKIDIDKMYKAFSNGYSGIRMFQPDVFLDKYDWKQWLIKIIALLKETKEIIWIFPNNPVYETYIEQCRVRKIPFNIIN